MARSRCTLCRHGRSANWPPGSSTRTGSGKSRLRAGAVAPYPMSCRCLPLGKSLRPQPAGGTFAAAETPGVPVLAVAEIAGVGLGEKKLDQGRAADLLGQCK